ncbi:MAG: YqaJ viral recombinase family protein [Spirochaetia bacterium]|jgi:putative phage-type endonuclease|nr:YqaJ viral recombinase family protein [Spirochaetia bacterium]
MIYYMEQGKEEWLNIRLGKITASRVAGILKGSKGSYLASRKNYMAEKVCEILTGQQGEHFVSKEMQWGTDNEPLARSAYEAITGNTVEEVGFIIHDSISDLGSSPDGLIGTDGGVEIKCPNTATHLELLLGGKVKRDYIIQMNVNMMCDNRKWWDYVDYDPRLPDEYSIFIQRFQRDEKLVAEITMEVIKFNAELDALVKKLKGFKK